MYGSEVGMLERKNWVDDDASVVLKDVCTYTV